MEQRRDTRHEVQMDASMQVYEDTVTCNIDNISKSGAYVRIDDEYNDVMSMVPAGSDALLIIDTEDDPFNIHGKILRYSNTPDGTFVALFFSSPVDLDQFNVSE